MAPGAGALYYYCSCSCLLFLLLAAGGRASNSAAAATTTNNKPQPQQLVQSTCNSTTYYDVCVAALAADPSTSTVADVRGLCPIAVSAAATNASAAGASVLASAAAYQSQAPLLRACAARYADARQALSSAQEAIKEEAYDYAFVHVSAAAEYPTMCRALFRRASSSSQQRGGAAYPSELAKREEGLRRLCTVVLDIISLLLVPY